MLPEAGVLSNVFNLKHIKPFSLDEIGESGGDEIEHNINLKTQALIEWPRAHICQNKKHSFQVDQLQALLNYPKTKQIKII